MSYNISTVQYIGAGRLSITAEKVAEALEHFKVSGVYLPEDTFLNPGYSEEPFKGGEIECPNWHSEGSGSSYDSYLYALGLTTGTAEIMLCWEGGDDYTGLRVFDGEVVERVLVFSLGAITEKDPTGR